MDLLAPAEAPAAPPLRERTAIDDRFKWNLAHIFESWDAWQAAYSTLEQKISDYARRQGTLANGADELLGTLKLADDIGQLTYKVWYFASLRYDEDQRDNQVNAKRQQVQILFAKASQAMAWFNPELLAIPLPTVQEWLSSNAELAVYRFVIEDLYRQQEHVLDDKGEHLLSLSSRFSTTPNDAYAALSTADLKNPVLELSSGEQVTLSYGQYRALLATNRHQPDRARAFAVFHSLFETNLNTYASLYNGVLQRDWFHAQSRGYKSTLDAALHGNNIPPSVVENLIETTKQGTEPLRRYHRLRKRVLGLTSYHSYDTAIPIVDVDRKYPYDDVLEWLPASVAPLGEVYQRQLRDVLFGD
jgi:oligoendopeptidase F